MKPLYMKLKDREYEDNQELDRDSVEWLKRELNLKKKTESLNIVPIREEIFLQYVPNKSWFNSGRTRTIHGISHTLRVMLYSYILCKIYEIERVEPFLVAASIHDIKRINDREDANHGKRVSEWFYKNNLKIKNGLSKEEIREICLAVDMTNNSKLKIGSILKSADALDRYRLPKRKWWLKKELVPLSIPTKVINFSKHFTVWTEEDILNGKDPLIAILDLARKYNLVID